MAKFKYTVLNRKGEKVSGEKEAQSRDDLVQYLLNNGFTVISINEDLLAGLKNLGSIEIGGLALSERVLIAKQLATMISAGIPIIQSINILREQSEKQSIKAKFDVIYKKIEAGSQLSEAFEEAGGILSEVQINLIAAGEKSGNLNEMLIKVAEDMEKSKQLRGKILGAMIYPAIIFVVLIVIVGIMIVFMIPQVEELYRSLGADELPAITRFLVDFSTFVSSPLFLVVTFATLLSLFFIYKNITQKPEGKIFFDKLKLKIPVFGNLIRKIQLVQFCRLTSMLSKSGVPIIDTVQIVSKSLSSELYSTILQKAKTDVIKGSALSIAIAKNNQGDAYPKILVRVIGTGEDAGKLDKVLEDMYKYYDAEVEQITANLTKLLEPFILVLVGGLVAFLAVAIYFPIYQIGNVI